MREEKKQISIDQFYSEKFQNADLQIDATSGWAQFEQQSKSSKIHFLRGGLLVLFGVVVITSIFLLNKSNPSNDPVETNSSRMISSKTNSEIKNRNQEDVVNERRVINEVKGTVEKSEVKLNEKGNENSSVKRIKSSSTLQFDVEEINHRNAKKDLSDNDQKFKEESPLIPNLVINDPKNSNVFMDINNTDNVNDSNKNFVSKTNEVSLPERYLFEFEMLNLPSNLLNSSFIELPMIEIRMPYHPKSSPNWTIDLGLSFGKEYELTDNFDLNETNIKMRFSHLSLIYNHLSNRLFDTYAYVSFDKVYGEKEFVGERIVRTYKDNNLSLGYGIKFAIFRKLDLESGVSLGYSMIDKVEFEQKPTWVDGAVEYKDYTETVYEMRPTATYQTHLKLNYHLSECFNIFTGVVYRTQFTDQLRSDQIVRENSLTTFSNLQFLTGIRYNIN